MPLYTSIINLIKKQTGIRILDVLDMILNTVGNVFMQGLYTCIYRMDGFCRVLTMLYITRKYRAFGLWPSSFVFKNTRETFWKLDAFPSSGLPPHLRKETHPVPETLCSLVFFGIASDG
jgi:hypothetical protein